MNYNTSFMELQLKDLQLDLDNYRGKVWFWTSIQRQLLPLTFFLTGIFFLARDTGAPHDLPALLVVLNLISLIFLLFTQYKKHLWEVQASRSCSFMRSIEVNLVNLYKTKVTCLTGWEMKKNGELRCCGNPDIFPNAEERSILRAEGFEFYVDGNLLIENGMEE